MTKVIQPKIKIIPRTKNLRPLSPDAQKYSPPKPVNYRSPSPYARIANFGWGRKPSSISSSSD